MFESPVDVRKLTLGESLRTLFGECVPRNDEMEFRPLLTLHDAIRATRSWQ